MIECEHISYSYDGVTRALDDVTLSIADGEFVCVLGGNGSGKSTLAKHLNALLVPDEGRVTVRGLDTADPEYVYDIRSTVGLVFQSPDDQLVATLVEDDVAFGPENLGVAPDEIRARVTDALREVGLMSFGRHETHALSGGQKQRVAIAGVLAMHPDVLVLDEASAMLDPRGRAGLMRVCRELHAQGMTIVMVTHFMEEAALADRVVVLDGGRIALMGAPEDVLSRAEVLERLDLEVPSSCRLGLALRAHGVDVAAHVDEAAMLAEVERLVPADGQACAPADASDTTGARQTPGEPCLVFEHVSYSYEASVRERTRGSRVPPARAEAGGVGQRPRCRLGAAQCRPHDPPRRVRWARGPHRLGQVDAHPAYERSGAPHDGPCVRVRWQPRRQARLCRGQDQGRPGVPVSGAPAVRDHRLR